VKGCGPSSQQKVTTDANQKEKLQNKENEEVANTGEKILPATHTRGQQTEQSVVRETEMSPKRREKRLCQKPKREDWRLQKNKAERAELNKGQNRRFLTK